ncbi:hypothetical protein AQUCO_02000058v1 [Aquilegia coerulea]|uniref:FBD domain-containing protein n=1 Tax=Aquilegia coerulea TaxID=218851 RepID=A0A2G5DFT7_AQUCA|nr:hypothetical protein AQUCO_02000058v1 [Aquilegia coerulea]
MLTMSLCDVDFLKLYINFYDVGMQFIASFLGRFSNLKFLSIHQSSWNDCIHFPHSNVSDLYWVSQSLAFIDHLKIAEISLCPGDNALALVKYLIKIGKDLEFLVIRFSSRFWELCEVRRIVDDLKKEKASAKLLLCYQSEPNPPNFEEVNEHHRKYTILLSAEDKRTIYEQKRQRCRLAEIEDLRVQSMGRGIPSCNPAEFLYESLDRWMPPDFFDEPLNRWMLSDSSEVSMDESEFLVYSECLFTGTFLVVHMNQ